MHLAGTLLGVALGVLLTAVGARADQVVVVLDRGEAAREGAETHERVALALLEAHGDDAIPPRLVVYGARPDGRPRSGVVTRGFEAALGRSRTQEGWRYDGVTDARRALDLARGRATSSEEPLLVFLVGPFAGEEEEEAEVIAAWGEEAPAESRIVPLFAGRETWTALGDARGLVRGGWVLLGHGEAQVEAEPFAPLAENARLEARIVLPLDLVPVGRADGVLPLQVTSDDAGDLMDVDAREDGLHIHLRRADLAKTHATVAFRNAGGANVLGYASPPPPIEVHWDEVVPGARVEREGDAGADLVFDALDVVGPGPPPVRLAILATGNEAGVAWTVRDEDGALPPGLVATVTPADSGRPHVTRHDVELAFGYAGAPVDARGTLLLEAEGHDATFRIPYRVSTAKARLHVRPLGEPSEVRLPLEDGDRGLGWSVELLAGNVPPQVTLRPEVEPADVATRLALEVVVGGVARRVGSGEAVAIDGQALPTEVWLRPRLHEGAWPADGHLRLALETGDGVEGVSDGTGRLRARRPRLALERFEGSYVLRRGALETERPWRLLVDPDGGPAAWRARLEATPPTLTVPEGARTGWRLRTLAPGTWGLEPEGTWTGARAPTFEGEHAEERLALTWPHGEAPGTVAVPVEVLPRWGRAGWILVGLAAIALVIGAIALSHLRSPPVVGTLLYVVEGKEGAVGRLDLGGVGRTSRTLRADAADRLHLGGGEGRRLGRVYATRVGGMIDVAEEGGGATRHLLVDGLTLACGPHRLRYVSGNPDESRIAFTPDPVPDLLGPEYDLEGGRIRALGGTEGESQAPEAKDGEAAGEGARF